MFPREIKKESTVIVFYNDKKLFETNTKQNESFTLNMVIYEKAKDWMAKKDKKTKIKKQKQTEKKMR